MRIALFFLVCLQFIALSLLGQKTAIYEDPNIHFKKGTVLYNKGVYALAQSEFGKVIFEERPVQVSEWVELQTQAEYYYAKCAVLQGLKEGEKLMVDFIRKHNPKPIASMALLDLAKIYYDKEDYNQAIRYYEQVDFNNLTRQERAEARFNLGYAYFVKNNNAKAKGNFKLVKDVDFSNYYAANYYYGMTSFFDKEYEEALKSFEKANARKQYSEVVPYYISQIYFAQKSYADVISTGTDALKNTPKLRYKTEINQLVGQSYFELGEYDKALPYLENYVAVTDPIRPEELYQVAYTRYKAEQYPQAAENFKELSQLNSLLGQNALYNLGNSYLKFGQRAKAKDAFSLASRMNFDKEIKDQALFQYAKISYELRNDRDAVNALLSVPDTSPNHREAQQLLGEIFLNTNDYAKAIDILEGIPDKDYKLKETYQKVTYSRGIQLYRDGDINGAVTHFQKAKANPIDTRIDALTTYWLADIDHKRGNYIGSARKFEQFLTAANTLKSMPDESSVHTANYAQGYNYLKQQEYRTAGTYFEKTVEGIDANRSYIYNDYVKRQIKGDAILRAGDCHFKQKKYQEASAYYDRAYNEKSAGYDYAMYQNAIIKGLQGDRVKKIILLEKLESDVPNTQYADDALLALGSTYVEMGKYAFAVAPLEKLIRRYSNSSPLINRAYLKLGRVKYSLDENTVALENYKKVMNNNPTPGESQAALAGIEEIYIENGDPDGYFSYLENNQNISVSELAKDSVTYKVAYNQFIGGEYDKAANSFARYTSNYPRGRYILPAYYNRGEAYLFLEKTQEALPNYEYIISKGNNSYYARALSKAGIISIEDKQYAKAFQYFNTLEPLAGDAETQFLAQLGAMRSAYFINNNAAVFKYADAVINNPKASTPQQATAHYFTGKTALQLKEYDKALAAFEKVISLTGNEEAAESRYQVAYIYYMKRDLARAKRKSSENNTTIVGYDYWRAKNLILFSDVHAELGELITAKAALQAIIENYKGDQTLIDEAKTKLAKLEAKEAGASRLQSTGTKGDRLMDDPIED